MSEREAFQEEDDEDFRRRACALMLERQERENAGLCPRHDCEPSEHEEHGPCCAICEGWLPVGLPERTRIENEDRTIRIVEDCR